MSKELYENLNDFLTYTHRLGVLDTIKVVGTADATKFSSMLEDRSVVFYGSLKKPIAELAGQTVGFARIGVLDGFMKYPAFQPDLNGSITFKEENGTVTELAFKGKTGTSSNYRFVGAAVIEKKINVPEFKGSDWDLEYSPTKNDVAQLKYLSGILSGYESTFTISVEDGVLTFNVGSNSSDRTTICINDNELTVNNQVTNGHAWQFGNLLTILSMCENAACKMYISNNGVIRITLDSGQGFYEYYLLATPV